MTADGEIEVPVRQLRGDGLLSLLFQLYFPSPSLFIGPAFFIIYQYAGTASLILQKAPEVHESTCLFPFDFRIVNMFLV